MAQPASGQVRCGRTQRAKANPRLPGYVTCPVWSRGAGLYKLLSPMLLQNIEIMEPREAILRPGYTIHDRDPDMQRATATCFENYWQGSKIYRIDLINPDAPIIPENLKPSFWTRRASVYASDGPVRRALPKAQYGTPIAGYYRGSIMEYVESRQKIYIPMYQNLVREHPTFRSMLADVHAGRNLLLIGPDGYDHMIPLTIELLDELVLRSDMIYGHELVLCHMLISSK